MGSNLVTCGWIEKLDLLSGPHIVREGAERGLPGVETRAV